MAAALALISCDSASEGPAPGTLGGSCATPCATGLSCVDGLCAAAESDAGAADSGAPPDASDRPDASAPEDAGAASDVGPPDSGALEACAPAGSMCVEAADCGMESPGPSNCPFCPPDNRAPCFSGACETPPVLELGDVQEVGFTVTGNLSAQVESLVGVVLARETSGDLRLDCDDVLRPGFDLGNGCYNVLTTRLITISQPSQTYNFPYGRFPSGQEVLLLVYGFSGNIPDDAPLGVSCTPHTTGAPGSGRAFVNGRPMQPL